jgi:PAS domain S-box-containing protein
LNIDEEKLYHMILDSEEGSNRVRMIKLLEERPCDIDQIAYGLDLNHDSVKHNVELLEKRGIISKVDQEVDFRDVYRLDLDEEVREILDSTIDRYEREKGSTKSLGFLRRIIRQTDEGIVVLDRDLKVFSCNERAGRFLGYDPGDLMGLNADLFLDDQLRDLIRNKIDDDNVVNNVTVRLKHRSGKNIEVNLSMDTMRDDKDRVIGVAIMLRDTAGQIRMVEKPDRKMERYRCLFDKSPRFDLIVDRRGSLKEANFAALDALGNTIDKLKNTTIFDLIPDPEDKSRMGEALEDIRKGGFKGIDTRIRCSGGRTKTISFGSGCLIPGFESRTNEIILWGEDLSDVMKRENKFEETSDGREIVEDNLRSLARSIPLGVIFVDRPDGRISFVNDEAREICHEFDLGATAEDRPHEYGLHRPNGDLFRTEDLPTSRALFHGEEVKNKEVLIRSTGDGDIHLMVNAIPIRDKKGEIKRAVGIFRDITRPKSSRPDTEKHHGDLEALNLELLKSQEELEISRNEYSDFFDFTPAGLFKTDRYGMIMDVNETGAELLNKPRNHILQRPFANIIAEEDRRRFRQMLRNVCEKGGKTSMRVRIEGQSGREMIVSLAFIDDEQGERSGCCYLAMLDI